MKKSGLWLLAPVALMMVSAPAMAAEPSVREVYAAARAGQVDKAVTMMDEVLKAHPNSAKAHYVQAELMAKQGRTADARTQLATAEKLAPGLPGIQPQSVTALKAQLNGGAEGNKAAGNGAVTTTEAPRPARSRGISWVGIVLIGALVFGVLAFFRRRNRQAEVYNNSPMGYGSQSGPGFGGPGYGAPGYGNQGFGQGFGGGYPPQGGGMGSSILGGLATGAAAGAGFAAGEKIIDGMFGDHKDEQRKPLREDNSGWDSGNSNQDMGGNDFGISDDSSWDSSGDDNGGDW